MFNHTSNRTVHVYSKESIPIPFTLNSANRSGTFRRVFQFCDEVHLEQINADTLDLIRKHSDHHQDESDPFEHIIFSDMTDSERIIVSDLTNWDREWAEKLTDQELTDVKTASNFIENIVLVSLCDYTLKKRAGKLGPKDLKTNGFKFRQG